MSRINRCHYCGGKIDQGKSLCERCIGPVPTSDVCVVCGSPAKASCDTCAENFCNQHWWRHSHNRDDAPPGGGRSPSVQC
jgi:predicted amidophosphoribosyltransferase